MYIHTHTYIGANRAQSLAAGKDKLGNYKPLQHAEHRAHPGAGNVSVPFLLRDSALSRTLFSAGVIHLKVTAKRLSVGQSRVVFLAVFLVFFRRASLFFEP